MWGGEVRPALGLASTDPVQRFGRGAVERLSGLAEFAALALEHCEIRNRLERTVDASVRALAKAVELRDGYTSEHSEEVVSLAQRVGEQLGLSAASLGELGFAARLHDIGKIGVPDAILRKPGHLAPDEWEVMRQHPIWGAQVLKSIPGLEGVAWVVRAEHERCDGTGYPDGLSGSDIPIASRIILACDAFHAMTSDRPYRPAMARSEAFKELAANAGRQVRPERRLGPTGVRWRGT
jgi:HD-GYP domain-containing protein (c-di-GMP phosphodiesterase class II)